MSELLKYYSEPGVITKLERFQTFTEWLSPDPGAIYQVIQGLLVHDMWVSQYGVKYNPAHEYPQKTAYMEDLLDKALELDNSNLAIPRHPRDRVIVCCREFATLMCAFLRAKKIPARSRCGFALYFGWDGKYEDHWICEYWNGTRWVMADPQFDPFQQSTAIGWAFSAEENADDKIRKSRQLNPRDLKSNEFVTAGQAWKLCREGKASQEDFGISCPIKPEWGIDSLYGLWFVRGQLLRDFAALNKVETVPFLVRISKGLDWKPWRLLAKQDHQLSDDEWSMLDQIAEFTLDVDRYYSKIRDAYTSLSGLAVPDAILLRE